MRNLKIVALVSFFTDLGTYMVYPLVPLFLVSVGTTPLIIGVIEGVAESITSILKFVTGYFSDRLKNRKRLAIYGYGFSAIGRLLLIFSQSWIGVSLWRLADRVGKGIRTAPRDALIIEAGGKEKHGRSFGIQQTMDMLGAAIGVAVAFGLIFIGGKQYSTVFLYSIIPVLIGFVSLFFLKDSKGITLNHTKSLRINWRDLDLQLKQLLLVILLFTIANSSNQFLILRASDIGMTTDKILLLYLVYHLSTSILSYPIGFLSDKIGRKNLLVGGYILYGFIYVAFAMIHSAQWIWLLFVLYGIYTGMTKGVEKALVADRAPSHLKGTMMGLYAMITGIGLLPASILTGFIWDHFGAASSFYFNGVLALVSAGFIYLVLSRKMQRTGQVN